MFDNYSTYTEKDYRKRTNDFDYYEIEGDEAFGEWFVADISWWKSIY